MQVRTGAHVEAIGIGQAASTVVVDGEANPADAVVLATDPVSYTHLTLPTSDLV